MANDLRVYRRFYSIVVSDDASTSYTLINPSSLAAVVRNISQGSTVVEASATVANVSVGMYYADLSSSLYNTDDEYEVNWQVNYLSSSPLRNLYTRFKFPETGSSSGGTIVKIIKEIDVEILKKNINYELVHNH